MTPSPTVVLGGRRDGTTHREVALLASLPEDTADALFPTHMVLQHEQQHVETMLATHQLRDGSPILGAGTSLPAGRPVPHDAVLVPEMNLGQLSLLLRARYLVDVVGYNHVRGLPLKAAELAQAITDLIETTGDDVQTVVDPVETTEKESVR